MKLEGPVVGLILVVTTVCVTAFVVALDARQMAAVRPYLALACGLGLPASIALMFVVMRLHQGAATASWEEVAQARGLAFQRGGVTGAGWGMQGSLRGVGVSVKTGVRQVGNKRRVVTLASADLGQGCAPSGLQVTPERLRDKLARAVGGQDVQVGVPDLDPRLRFRGEREGDVRAFARRPGVADALRALAEHDGFSIEGELARVESPGLLHDGALLGSQLDELVALALAARGEA